MRPRLLDLFCGAGGAAAGYHRAGFDVTGVDIRPQPNYPFEFIRADVMELPLGWGEWTEFAAVHASPPCQSYSRAMRHLADPRPQLIDPLRDLLEQSGLPWIIENVQGAPIPHSPTLDGRHGVMVCGTAVGLRVQRHRLFETSFPVPAPGGCDHRKHAMNPHNQAGRDRITAEHGPGDQEKPWRAAMEVEWMSRHEAREAIPPAYTEWIGRYLMAEVRSLLLPDGGRGYACHPGGVGGGGGVPDR